MRRLLLTGVFALSGAAAHAAGLVEINPSAPPGQQVGNAGGVQTSQPGTAFSVPGIAPEAAPPATQPAQHPPPPTPPRKPPP